MTDQPKQILGPKGDIWATAPNESWNLRDDPWPDVNVRVEACWSSRFETPARYDYGILRLKRHWSDGMSEWINEDGYEVAFNPDFWRPIAGSAERRGEKP